MTPLVLLAVPLAAAAGGLLRWWIAGRLDAQDRFPLGTWLVNLTGSAAIGALAAGFARWQIPLDGELWLLAAGAGLGSFTTVSAFALHGVVFWEHDRALALALAYVAATMLACPLAAAGAFSLVMMA